MGVVVAVLVECCGLGLFEYFVDLGVVGVVGDEDWGVGGVCVIEVFEEVFEPGDSVGVWGGGSGWGGGEWGVVVDVVYFV